MKRTPVQVQNKMQHDAAAIWVHEYQRKKGHKLGFRAGFDDARELGGVVEGVDGGGVGQVVVQVLQNGDKTTVSKPSCQMQAAAPLSKSHGSVPDAHRQAGKHMYSRARCGPAYLDRALAGHDGLHEEAEHGEHGQTAVLQLLHLQQQHRHHV